MVVARAGWRGGCGGGTGTTIAAVPYAQISTCEDEVRPLFERRREREGAYLRLTDRSGRVVLEPENGVRCQCESFGDEC